MKRTKPLTTYRARIADTLPHFESLKAKLNHVSPVELSNSDVLRKAIVLADELITPELLRAIDWGKDGTR